MLVGQVVDGDLHAINLHSYVVVVGVQVNITKRKDKRFGYAHGNQISIIYYLNI